MSEERFKSQLIVLGSGTSVSGLGWEKTERWPPAFLLEGAGPELVLLEASEGVRYRIQNSGKEYTRVSDVLISHLHPDHFNLVPFVQSVVIKGYWGGEKFKREALNVYGPKGIEKAFWRIWKIKVGEHPSSVYGGLLKLNFFELGGGKTVDFYGSRLLAFNVFHAYGKVKSLAFRLETNQGVFAYLGDGGPSPGLEEAIKKVDIFLSEVSADIGEDKSTTSGHLNPYQVGELAQRAGVKKLLMTHYSGRDSPEAMIKDCRRSRFKGDILAIKDGDKIRIP